MRKRRRWLRAGCTAVPGYWGQHGPGCTAKTIMEGYLKIVPKFEVI